METHIRYRRNNESETLNKHNRARRSEQHSHSGFVSARRDGRHAHMGVHDIHPETSTKQKASTPVDLRA